jgi:hypothetical protein
MMLQLTLAGWIIYDSGIVFMLMTSAQLINMNKDHTNETVCQMSPVMPYVASILVLFIVLNSIDDKMIIYYNPGTSRFSKVLIFAQV